MIAWSDVVVVAPELSTVPNGSQTVFIADAYAQMNTAIWGAYLDRGAKYLAAHLATMSNRRGQAGAASEKHVGKIGQSNAVNKGPLNSSAYGEEYLRIIDTLPGARGPQAMLTTDLGPTVNDWVG
ncbi:MAG TPA: DUF4054 domain-containing protein [Chloroflexota bacterium]|nr:DUF4054 domain-containing protein [Chloroflexota bacterium]